MNASSAQMDLRVLVLDDYPSNARVAINDALNLLVEEAGEVSLAEIPLPTGGSASLEVVYEESPTRAREILLGDELDSYDLVLIDNRWDNTDEHEVYGLSLLQEMSRAERQHPFLVLFTQYPGDCLGPALSAGARALVSKDEKYHLLNILLATALASRAKRASQLEDRLLSPLGKIDKRLETEAPAMSNALVDAAAFAFHDKLPILIVGETGTGKELVARALHAASRRSKGPLEILHCATLPTELAESELFGHVKGAFTGAERAKVGALRRAAGGTLFLDEVQDIPQDVQTKLLRALDGLAVRAVGGDSTFEVDVRLIAATNGDPHKLISEGRLRDDFYYRLAGGIVRLPPLRSRVEDFPDLIGRFAQEFEDGTSRRFSSSAIERLRQHSWPGNIRELRSTVFRSLAASQVQVLGPDELRLDTATTAVERPGSVLPSDSLLDLLRHAPSKGVAKSIVELLVERYPDWIDREELLSMLAGEDEPTGGEERALQVKISQIRAGLRSTPFGIEGPSLPEVDAAAYRLVHSKVRTGSDA